MTSLVRLGPSGPPSTSPCPEPTPPNERFAEVHLADYLSLHGVPAAGVAIGLTRRCPLHCDHCGTKSTMESEQAPAELFRRFVDTFTPGDRPEVLAISGGEAFLRPKLLAEIASAARRTGCRPAALSGMYWARGGRIPPAIRRAIDELDHFSASLDVFHEREVPREDVFAVLDVLVAEGRDVSVHVVGLDESDPYLEETTTAIRERFNDRVPMLCNGVNPVGRAATWLPRPPTGPPRRHPVPCSLSNWPVVGWDGTVTACGNDDVVEGPAPPHLRVGHASEGWPAIRERMQRSPMVRAVRTFGPEYVNDRFGSGAVTCTGFCSTCQKLSGDGPLVERVAVAMAGPSMQTMEATVEQLLLDAGPRAYARRFALARYADLVTLGLPEVEAVAPAPGRMVRT
jgi:pyruvate-formate lyase-activating enzyme